MLARFTIYYEFSARYCHVDAHMVELSLVVVTMRRLHYHPAAHDPIGKRIQLSCSFSDMSLNRLRWRHITQRQLQWNLNLPDLRQLSPGDGSIQRPPFVC